MVKIPDNIQKSLSKLAAATKTDINELIKQLKELKEKDPTIQAIPNEQQQVIFAYTLLARRYTRTGGAKQMYLRPLSKPRARQTKSGGAVKYVGGLYALVKLIEQDNEGNEKVGEVQYAAGTLWEKAASAMRELSPDKVYRTALRATDAKNGLELGGNDASFIEAEESIPTADEYFKSDMESQLDNLSISLDEMKINDREDQTDLKIVRAMVLDTGTGTTAKMGEFGRYAITDDSFIGKENFVMWVHPEDVKYGISSDLYFIGTVNVDNSSNPPISRFDCHFVVPAGATIKREEEPIPVQQETEDISLDDIKDDFNDAR